MAVNVEPDPAGNIALFDGPTLGGCVVHGEAMADKPRHKQHACARGEK